MKKEKCFLILLLASIIFMAQGIADITYAHSTNNDNNLRLALYKEGIIDNTIVNMPPSTEVNKLNAALTFVRFLGVEDTLKPVSHPFKDVYGIDSLYIGYLYEKGYIKGTSADLFGSNNPCDAKTFMSFILQALGYTQGVDFEWATSLDVAKQINLITSNEHLKLEKEPFTYENMFILTEKALTTQVKDRTLTLRSQLKYPLGLADSSPKKLKLSNMPENNTVCEIENGIFKLKNIPHINDYNYLWIHYEPINQLGNTINTDIVSISWDDAYPIQLEIPQLPSGQYYANIRLVDDEWESEKDLTGRTVLIDVNGNDIDFAMSPIYAHNKRAILNRKMRDTKALTHEYKNNEEIRKLALAITKGKKSNYEKVKAVHDWVCENIYYNWDDYTSGNYYRNQEAIDVLHSKLAVCQGYAELTAALIESLDIPCHIVSGYALGDGTDGKWHTNNIATKEINHAWNEAFVDGKWIILDTTWDSSNLYENGQYSTNTGLKGYTYFDPTLEAFSATHKIMR